MAKRKSIAKKRQQQKPFNSKDISAGHHKSKRKKLIASMPTFQLCTHCKQIIEWRKRTNKYKILKQSRKCASCGNKSIYRAYHILCDGCAYSSKCCAKCKIDLTHKKVQYDAIKFSIDGERKCVPQK
ncbi:hypothetical protein MHBO_000996 [Bonamia ostreae]|uniref:Cysteine-rich PDZ-binding protein n=1 Tax=Bonamia ostreae TaxID=126728 RepID=A0ABV2AIQ2_9EUKA